MIRGNLLYFLLITAVLLFTLKLLLDPKNDQRHFLDKVSYSIFSNISLPSSVTQFFTYFTTPKFDFVEDPKIEPIKYSELGFWASHPEIVDSADISPNQFSLDKQEQAEVDLFFVHPTTYVSAVEWNQPLSIEEIELKKRSVRYLHDWSLRDQASIFNSCCKVYAPYYRQATLASFLTLDGNGKKALDLAYNDVRNAFDYFIQNFNSDRPFILAGHSQGSLHVIRLLSEMIIGTPLLDRMVVAYTVGYPSKPMEGLKVCKSKIQTGCQISWNTESVESSGRNASPNEICINPLSWAQNGNMAPKELNLGSISFSEGNRLLTQLIGARCHEGKLMVDEINSKYFRYMPFGKGIYHHYDYSLFHMNIRKNIAERIDNFMSQRDIE